MGEPVAIDFGNARIVSGVRPKPGVVVPEGGQLQPDDMEVFAAIALPTVKPGGLLGANGQRTALLVPVGELVRPMTDFLADANKEPG